MVINSKSPLQMMRGLTKYRDLIWQLVKKDISERYKGSVLGLLWPVILPLAMLAIYTFVFSFIFKARWDTGSDSKTEFALALFIGLIAHGVLADNINRAPSLIIGNVNFVKKVVFPLDILPWVTMGTTLFHASISLLVWIVVYVLVNQNFHWTSIFLPLIFLPLVFYCMGLAWLFSAIGVFLRDISQITGLLTTILLFLSPIFYPISIIPERFQTFMYANPLTVIVEQARSILMWGQLPDWQAIVISFVVSVFVAWLGFAFFQKARIGFADVL